MWGYRVFTSTKASIDELAAFSLGLLAILVFIVKEMLESHIYAYSAKWVNVPYLGSWIFFLAFILGSPLLLLVDNGNQIIPQVISYFAIAFIAVCSITNLGKIFFGYGLTKKIALIFWASLALFISVLLATHAYV